MNKEQTHICRRCGRKLKSPEAKARGMGPVCYRKWLKLERVHKLFNTPSLQSDKDKL